MLKPRTKRKTVLHSLITFLIIVTLDYCGTFLCKVLKQPLQAEKHEGTPIRNPFVSPKFHTPARAKLRCEFKRVVTPIHLDLEQI